MEIKTCSCGNNSLSDDTEAECKYSGVGWLLLFIGMSAQPTEVVFRCKKCGEIIESKTDEKTLKQYIGR